MDPAARSPEQIKPTELLTWFLSTVRRDGRPHAAGVGALWHDGDLYFTSGPGTQKSHDLAANPASTVSVHLDGIDLVFEGEASRVTDPDTLEKIASLYRDGGWPVEVEGDAFTAPFSAPSAGPPPWYLYRLDFDKVFGVATTEPNGATRWRFTKTETFMPSQVVASIQANLYRVWLNVPLPNAKTFLGATENTSAVFWPSVSRNPPSWTVYCHRPSHFRPQASAKRSRTSGSVCRTATPSTATSIPRSQGLQPVVRTTLRVPAQVDCLLLIAPGGEVKRTVEPHRDEGAGMWAGHPRGRW